MNNRKGPRYLPAFIAGLILILIGSSICLHLFFPFYHFGYYPWHPYFPFFGGFFILRFFLFAALIFFIGRRFFWGRRWDYAGPGYHRFGGYHRFSGYPLGCGGPADQHEANHPWGRHQFRGHHRHGNASFEKVGSRSSDDFIELASGFGTTEKKITSRNFQGGDVTTIDGRLILDLREADLTGETRLKITQVRGVTSVIVPREWVVKAGEGTVFTVFHDSQTGTATVNPEKVLIIDGTCVMGDIEVRTS